MKHRLSLRRTLLLGLLSTILLAWLTGVGLVFREARQEVSDVFDADLARSARVMTSLLRHEVEEERNISRQVGAVSAELGAEGLRHYPLLASLLEDYRGNSQEEVLDFGEAAVGSLHRYESKLALVARYQDGGLMLQTPGAPDFPVGKSGFFDFKGPSGKWRGFGLTDPVTGFVVQVGEQEQVRAGLVDSIVGNSLLPFLLVLPLMALVIWLGVGRALRPLSRLTAEMKSHTPSSLAPLPSIGVPMEVQPLVNELNGLLERVAKTLEHERRFTADAAHELRTPLAALRAHAQLALEQSRDPELRKTLRQLLAGADRTSHLVAQLLTLARADAGPGVVSSQPVELVGLARRTLSELGQLAVEQQIELALEAAEAVPVTGDATALELLLRNLVDNSLRYTQPGGRVTVRIARQNGEVLLEVLDNGPGLAPAERERVFERFFRGAAVTASGSGLGLSIVQRIVDAHGARVALGEGLEGRGLGVRVVFPAVQK